MTHDSDSDDDHDDYDDSVDDDPVGREYPRRLLASRRRKSSSHARESLDGASPDAYAALARDNPTAFAVLVAMNTRDRSVGTLERVLETHFDHFDRALEHHSAHRHFANETLHTLTTSAGEVAQVGLRWFQAGIQQQVDLAQFGHDSELGKERNELMCDAVAQGSALTRFVLTCKAIKQRHASDVPEPNLSAEEAELAAADDRCIEVQTRQLLSELRPEALDDLRSYAPTLIRVFDRLRSRPITAAWVREVMHEAQDEAGPDELRELSLRLTPDVMSKFNDLIVCALSGGLR